MAVYQIVENDRTVSGRRKGLARVAADISGAARDKYDRAHANLGVVANWERCWSGLAELWAI
jgi:hypothetical protein